MESDWQEYPLPSMEEPNIPLYDLIDWLGNFPGHPEPLTPHHGYVMPEWIEEIVKEAADETCKDCGKKHEEGKCDLYGHETTLPDPPADLEWDGEDLDDPNAPGNYHPASYENGQGTHACPFCGHKLVDNAHSGYTGVIDGDYGMKSWYCPGCGADFRPAENRPMPHGGAIEETVAELQDKIAAIETREPIIEKKPRRLIIRRDADGRMASIEAEE